MKNHLYEALNNPPADNYREVRHLINKFLSSTSHREQQNLIKSICDFAVKNYDVQKITAMHIHIGLLQANQWNTVLRVSSETEK